MILLGDDIPPQAFVLGEDVEGKRFLLGVDQFDGAFNVGHRANGEDGAEQLVLHHGVVSGVLDVRHYGEVNPEILLVHFPAKRDLPVGSIQHSCETVEVPLIHNPEKESEK